jgi:hypothetical protein
MGSGNTKNCGATLIAEIANKKPLEAFYWLFGVSY